MGCHPSKAWTQAFLSLILRVLDENRVRPGLKCYPIFWKHLGAGMFNFLRPKAEAKTRRRCAAQRLLNCVR
jgi:hypothetical protein